MIYIISFILDKYLSNSLFTLLSLLLTYNKKNRKKLITISIILGLLYDIIYTNTLFINTIVFLLSIYLIEIIYKKNNYLNIIIYSLIIIIYYRLAQYIIINIIYNYPSYDIIKNIVYSILINMIYVNLVFLLKKIHKSKL